MRLGPLLARLQSIKEVSQVNVKTIIALLFLALALGGCSMLTTVVSNDVLRVTQGIVCGGNGRYRFNRAGESSAAGRNGSLTVHCVDEEGATQAAVTGQAFGAYYLFLATLWFAILFFLAVRGGREQPLAPSPDLTLSANEKARVRNLLDEGQKIRAIKEVREMAGIGLADAKAYVEEVQRTRDR